jgi:hypothetical protein
VTLGAHTILTSNAGNIVFDKAIDGGFGLTVDATENIIFS